MEGVLPLASDLETIAPIARTVEDVALLDAVMRGAGPAPLAPLRPEQVRIAVGRRFFWEDLEPEVSRVAQAALERLRGAGVRIIEVDFGDLPSRAAQLQSRMMMAGMHSDLDAYLRASGSTLRTEDVVAKIRAPGIARLFRFAAGLRPTAADAQQARLEADRISRAMEDIMAKAGATALAFPCEPVTAQVIKAVDDQSPWIVDGRRVTPLTLVRNTSVAAGLGLPAISLPCGLSSAGLPIGLELDAMRGGDARLLQAAASVERILGRLTPPHIRTA
jgi:mandelamide amidase